MVTDRKTRGTKNTLLILKHLKDSPDFRAVHVNQILDCGTDYARDKIRQMVNAGLLTRSHCHLNVTKKGFSYLHRFD